MSKPKVLSDGLAEWRLFWGTREPGSLEGDRPPRYLGGNLHEKYLTDPVQFTPGDFRLHPESPGHAAGPDAQDLGADVRLVGPGPAYESWKKTPDYQEWLKITELPK